MKCLIIGNFHHKNKIGLELIFKYLQYEYKFGTIHDIKEYDIIFAPRHPINTANYPDKKFIFGNHFSVIPDNKLLQINNIHKNSVYIQPSQWVCELWKPAEQILPVLNFPFPVEINKFKPTNSIKNKVFIYFKARKQEELNILTNFLNIKNIPYEIFDYRKRYKEEDYLKYLQESKYGIWLGAHESQGFALQEALSCNVPLIVWNVSSMNQEEGINYPAIKATSIPYWDERCGEYFYNSNEFEETYNRFINKLDTYKPREYIIENLNEKKCAENLQKLISEF